MDEAAETARAILRFLEIYAWIGLAVAGLFLAVGIERVDPAARRAYTFRPLVLPGIVVLWPLVLIRWIALERQKT